MKIADTIVTANKNLLRNKARTFLTVLAIFIGSFSITLTLAMNAGVDAFIDDQVNSYGGEDLLEIVATDLSSLDSSGMTGLSSGEPREYGSAMEISYITDEQIEKLKEIDGIDGDSLVIARSASADYVTNVNNDKKYVFNTVPLPPGDIHIATTAGRNVDNSSKDAEVLIPSSYVEYLGYNSDEEIIGETLTFHILSDIFNTDTEVTATVVGTQAPGVITQSSVYINSTLGDQIFDAFLKNIPEAYRASVSEPALVYVKYDNKNYDVDKIKKEIEDLGLSALTVDDMVGMIRTFFDAMTIVFTIFGAIALVAASIGIINTLLMSVEERTREIGLDKALGMSSGKVFLNFSFEAIMLGFWGSVFGAVVSYGVGQLINTYLHSDGALLADLPTFQLLTYTASNIISVTIVIMLISFVAGTAPALKAAKKNPIDALRYE